MNRIIFFLTILCESVVLHCSAQVETKRYAVDRHRTFAIVGEDKVYNSLFGDPRTNDTLRSDIIVNNDSLRRIGATSAAIKDDTLRIKVHQTTSAYNQTLLIKIFAGKFIAAYTFSTSGELSERRVNTRHASLVLSSNEIKRGQTIRGYVSFAGECVNGCWEKKIELAGNFKVIIK
jgi:hypothetical protein